MKLTDIVNDIGIDISTAYRWVRSGKLKAKKTTIDHHICWTITKRDYIKFLNEHKTYKHYSKMINELT